MSNQYEHAVNGNLLPHAKLTPALVREIRERHEWKKARIDELNEKYSVDAMAANLGMSKRAIERVLAYETWRQVP